MKKEEIERHITTIEGWLRRFDKTTYTKGKNKAIRDRAGKEIDIVLLQAERYFDKHDGMRAALFDFHGGNPYGYEESLEYQWFDRDMPRLLSRLKEMLEDKAGENDEV